MKKNIFVFTGLLAMLYITLSSDIDGAAHHGHGDVTGATSGTVGHCQTGTCHGGNNAFNVVQLTVTDTTTLLPVTTYTALHTYLVTITGNATAVTTNLPGFGFQASAVLGNHTLAGTYTIPTAAVHNMHTFVCGATTVVEHTNTLSQDTAGINKYSVQFYWTAPAPFTDSVTFYALLNAVNGDGGKTGDYPNTAPHVTLYENPADAGVTKTSATANEFTVYPNPSSSSPTISYSLLSSQKVSITICDITGRQIMQAASNEYQNAGRHTYHPAIATPGTYMVRLMVGDVSQSCRFVKL